MISSDYIWAKTQTINRDRFAELLIAAKGERTMKDFAKLCNVNPSTFTRISKKANKGASSIELIQAIAAHAAPNSGVTLEALAEANGYTLTQKASDDTSPDSADTIPKTMTRDILVQALLDRGAEVRLGNIRYPFSKSMSLHPDALIMTNAFGSNDEIWMVDTLTISGSRINADPLAMKSAIKQKAFNFLSRFTFISMNKVELFRPTKYSMVTYDRFIFEVIVDEFRETNVPTDISVICLDPDSKCVVQEFIFPQFSGIIRPSIFDSLPDTTEQSEHEYINSSDFDE